MKILAIETSGEACSAALLDGEQIIERYALAVRQHTQFILPMLESLLAEAGWKLMQLDAIAFGCGPGSFTGVRIASSVAQACALVGNLPVIPISTLHSLAQRVYRDYHYKRVLPALDARMKEVYWGGYYLRQKGDTVLSCCIEDALCAPEAVTLPTDQPTPNGLSWVGVGSGWDTYHVALQGKLGLSLQQWFPKYHPRAWDVAMLAGHAYRKGKFVSAEHAVPVYLRDKVV